MTERLTQIIDKANRTISLRSEAQGLIESTWVALNRRDEEKIKLNTRDYMELRRKMKEEGIDNEDILCYDERFSNLPWEACGYQTPKLTKDTTDQR